MADPAGLLPFPDKNYLFILYRHHNQGIVFKSFFKTLRAVRVESSILVDSKTLGWYHDTVSLDHQHNRLLNPSCAWLEQQLPIVQEKFGENLLGVAIFGSRADGTATQNSDVDVLVCLKSQYEISRSLYSWWDGRIFHKEFECNPVFSYLPSLERASSLWYEIALNHQILYDRQNTLESTCAQLMQRVQNGQVQRKWSQGQPYWLLELAR